MSKGEMTACPILLKSRSATQTHLEIVHGVKIFENWLYISAGDGGPAFIQHWLRGSVSVGLHVT